MSELFRKSGVWFFICGAVITPFAIRSEATPLMLVALLSGLSLIGADILLELRDTHRERGGILFFLPHAIAAVSFLIFFVRSLIPAKTDDFGSRLTLLLLIFFLIAMTVSILLRLALHAGKEALLSSNQSLRIDRGRRMRDALISTVTALLVFTAVNYFAAIRNPILDLTPGHYSFGEETARIIRSIPGRIEIHAFLPVQQATRSSGTEKYAPELFRIAEDIRIMLDQLPVLNPGILLHYHNADLEGGVYGEFGPVTNGTILFRVLKSGASTSLSGKPYTEKRVFVYGERDLANLEKESLRSLVQLSSEPKIVYFTAANGERWLSLGTGAQARGIETLKNELNFYNFSIKSLDTESGWPGAIPADAAAVVVTGPVVPLSDVAKKSLIEYLERSGRLIVTIDPDGGETFDWLLSGPLGSSYRFRRDRFTTLSTFPGIIFTDSAEKHRTTENLEIANRGVLIFPGAGYFERGKKSSAGTTYTEREIIRISPQSYPDRNGDGKRDAKGGAPPHPLVLAFESGTGAKAILFSSTDWISEFGLRFPADNRNIILAADSLFWLTESPLSAALRPEARNPRTVQMTPESKFRNILFGIVLFPLFVVALTGTSVVIYRKRRFHREANE